LTTQRKAIIAVFVISFVLMLQGVTGSVIAYIGHSYPSSPVAQIMSLPALFGLAASFAVGPLATKINKKWLMLFCALMCVGYFAIFTLIGSKGPFNLLLLGAGLVGLAQGMSMTLMGAMLGEFVSPEKSGTYIGFASAILNGGGVVMNLIGGPIASGNGGENWPRVYLLGLAFLIPAILIFFVLMPLKPDEAPQMAGGPAAGPAPTEKAKLPVRIYLIFLLAVVFSIALCAFLFNLSYAVIDWFQLGSSVQASQINTTFTFVGLIAGMTYGFWYKLFKNRLILAAFSLATGGLLIFAFVHTLLGCFLAAALIGLGFNMMNPWIMSFIMQICPPSVSAIGLSLLMAGANLGMFLAPFVLNVGVFGSNEGLLMAGAFIAVACTVAASFVYSIKGTPLDVKESA